LPRSQGSRFSGDVKLGLQALEVVVAVGESRGIDRSVVGQAEAPSQSRIPMMLPSARVQRVNLIASIGLAPLLS
jgi:hypothetical protein